MATIRKKAKDMEKTKKKLRSTGKNRARAKNKDEVCMIEDELPATRVYVYEDDCCCLI